LSGFGEKVSLRLKLAGAVPIRLFWKKSSKHSQGSFRGKMLNITANQIPSDPRNRQASQVKAAAHQQAFATSRGSRGTSPERERPQKKLTPMERAQQEAAEARKKLQQTEIESGRVRGEIRKLQEQMEAVKSAHTQETQRAADREAGLWSDLNAIREQASLSARRASNYKTISLVMVAVLPLMVWAAWHYGHPAIVAQAASPATHTAHASAPDDADVPFATHEAPLSDDDPSEFTKGAGRLNRALDRFRNEPAETVLRRVHDQNAAHGISVCAFEWHKGEVSLIFGNQPGMEIGVTMTRCAEAVEGAAK
jgi:hypothetical protein